MNEKSLTKCPFPATSSVCKMADESMTTAVEPAAPPALEPESKTQGDVPMEDAEPDADKGTKTIEEPEGTNTFSVSLLSGHSSFSEPIAEGFRQSSTIPL